MDQKPRRQKHYTFMVIPHDATARSFSFKVSARMVYTALGVLAFSAVLVVSSVVYSGHLSRRLFFYRRAILRNREQQQIIDSFAQKTEEVNQAISELVREDNELRRVLGLKSWKSKIKLSSALDSSAHQELVKADLKLSERKESLEELKAWVNEVRQRFANTPSRWPLYGKIVSRFGYRVYPWRGFHTGVDISGSYGAPVRTTANGVVAYAGWRSGYGKTVVVEHGHGKSTLYAHCSSYAIKRGQNVKKGQVIAYVGNTGYTTGAHLHYEVRNWDRPVNPVAYLDLNVLSASRIWKGE